MDPRRKAGGPGRKASPYNAGQALVAVVNDPRTDNNRGWWGFGRQDPYGPPPPLDPYKYPNYNRKDLDHYLRIIRVAHQQFVRDRASLLENLNRNIWLGVADADEENEPVGKSCVVMHVLFCARHLLACGFHTHLLFSSSHAVSIGAFDNKKADFQ